MAKITFTNDEGEHTDFFSEEEISDLRSQLQSALSNVIERELEIYGLEEKLRPYEKTSRRIARKNKRERAYKDALLQIRDTMNDVNEIFGFINQVFIENGVKFE